MNGQAELLYIADKCSQMGIKDLGKKKFQKLVYLIEAVGKAPLGYDYEIYFYGPYSRELDDDLVELSYEGFLEFKRDQQSHLINVTDQAREKLRLETLSSDYQQPIDEQLRRFASKSPYDLELLTTTHLVASLLGTNADSASIEKNVKKVKGSKFSGTRIKAAMKEMNLA